MEIMKLCLTKAGINHRQKPLMPIKNVSKIHIMEERKEVQSKWDLKKKKIFKINYDTDFFSGQNHTLFWIHSLEETKTMWKLRRSQKAKKVSYLVYPLIYSKISLRITNQSLELKEEFPWALKPGIHTCPPMELQFTSTDRKIHWDMEGKSARLHGYFWTQPLEELWNNHWNNNHWRIQSKVLILCNNNFSILD